MDSSEDKHPQKKFNHVSSFDEIFNESSKKQYVKKKMVFELSKATLILKNSQVPLSTVLSSVFKDQNSAKVTKIQQKGDKTFLITFEIFTDLGLKNICKPFQMHPHVEKFDIVSDSKISQLAPKLNSRTRWFPRSIFDLDVCAKNVLMYGNELDADHPGFKDKEYRERRKFFTDIAMKYKQGDEIPYIEYTEDEKKTWGKVYQSLMELYPKYACKQFLENLPLLSLYCDYSEDDVPQLEKVSRFLQQKTGFRIRPVAGFLSPRDFLAGLAFRVFNCTQYIRHSSDPFYTPEPDLCHELLGHVPLLADVQFAQYSQEIGLSSLGASDDNISKLAACYLYTNEFGLCKENDGLKAYGAGLLSSISELEHAINTPEKIIEFDPERASTQEFYVTTFQPVYFASESFENAQVKVRKFLKDLKRPFSLQYDPLTSSVHVIDDTLSQDVVAVNAELQHAMKQLTNEISEIKF